MPFVQGKSSGASGASPQAATFTNNLAASGARIWCAIDGDFNGAIGTFGVSDSAGNTWTEVLTLADNNDVIRLSLWTAPVTAGGGTKPTITATTASALFGMTIAIAEFSGQSLAAGSGCIDKTATSNPTVATTAAATGTTGATTGANEDIIAWFGDAAGANQTAITPTAPMVNRATNLNDGAAQTAFGTDTSGASGTTVSEAWTLSNAETFATLLVVVKMAGAAGFVRPTIIIPNYAQQKAGMIRRLGGRILLSRSYSSPPAARTVPPTIITAAPRRHIPGIIVLARNPLPPPPPAVAAPAPPIIRSRSFRQPGRIILTRTPIPPPSAAGTQPTINNTAAIARIWRGQHTGRVLLSRSYTPPPAAAGTQPMVLNGFAIARLAILRHGPNAGRILIGTTPSVPPPAATARPALSGFPPAAGQGFPPQGGVSGFHRS